jgi:hypothetical protein
VVLAVVPACASGTTYKNYIVRTDRGWDIMCEPYVVQEGDWVYKLFRQKGEISHADFQEFLGIFGRLNPHVPNLDLLRPGQTIDIPLQKLEQGTLPGQASGMVTIPVVSLTQLDEMAARSLQPHEVQKGDTVSELIAERFGRYGTPAYKEGVRRFKIANAQITNIDRIDIGQRILLPDPSVRQQAWSKSIEAQKGEAPQAVQPEQPAQATAQPFQSGEQPPQAAAETDIDQKPAEQPMSAPATRPQAVTDEVLAEAAAIVGASFRNRGTYFVPREQAPDFEIDLSLHALMEMPDANKFVFTLGDAVMGASPEALEAFWPDAAVIAYTQASTSEEIVSAIFAALEKKNGETSPTPAAGQVAFEDQGLRAVVRAKWIQPQNAHGRLCITPISSVQEQTPAALNAYLRQNGIILKELLPGQTAAAAQAETPPVTRHAIRDVLHLAPANHKDLVQKLARVLGLKYAPNVTVEFFYAEMQIQAHLDLISAANGSELLLDFGDLQGDTVDAIRRSGPRVLQIDARESAADVFRRILSELGLSFEENPRFLGAARPARYNTEITIDGFLYARDPDRKALLTGAHLPQAITDLVTARGMQIIVW